MLPTGQVGFLPDSYICLASGAFDYSLKILGSYDPISPGLPPTFLTTLASVCVVDSLLPPLVKMSVTEIFPLYTFYLGILMTINSVSLPHTSITTAPLRDVLEILQLKNSKLSSSFLLASSPSSSICSLDFSLSLCGHI